MHNTQQTFIEALQLALQDDRTMPRDKKKELGQQFINKINKLEPAQVISQLRRLCAAVDYDCTKGVM